MKTPKEPIFLIFSALALSIVSGSLGYYGYILSRPKCITGTNFNSGKTHEIIYDSSLIKIVDELMDRRHASTILQLNHYTNRYVVPVSSLNTQFDRRKVLFILFYKITAGETTDSGRVEAWVHYLQDRIVHSKYPPMLDNGHCLYCPYWILKNRVGHCGQTNRVIVDGLNAAGFEARVVQLEGHVAAEVLLDGNWRFLDADCLDLGQFIRHADGTIPSAKEIHENPKLIDGVIPYLESNLYPTREKLVDLKSGRDIYTSTFSKVPYYYIKTATLEQERSPNFGWEHYKVYRPAH